MRLTPDKFSSTQTKPLPLLSMRLTPDLIKSSPQFWNALKMREIDLRGHRIPTIENLSATFDQFRVIDLSDNSLRSLEGFSTLKLLEILLVINNKLSSIGSTIGNYLPNLSTLILTRNSLASTDALIPLQHLPHLTELSLLDNPLSLLPNYRNSVIRLLPKLKILDFQKISTKERIQALEQQGPTFSAGEVV
ncbi:hypothetical protein GEMRC1_006566 [Eukaryota sp. GEM-RC1]